MKKKIVYTEGPIGRIRVIKNFLPPPERLIFREEGVKVTITLSRTSVEYFKRAAAKYHAPYQKMIRSLIDKYVERHPLP